MAAKQPFDPFAHPEHIHLSGRAKELTRVREIYEGRQYDTKADWWTGKKAGQSSDDRVPLRERKPCVISKLPKAGAKQVVRFLFGDGRFPNIKAEVIEPSEALGGVALDKDQAETLQTWLAELVERLRLKAAAAALGTDGIGNRTAIAILGLRDGNFIVERPQAEHCWARFRNDDPNEAVERFIWCYRYDAEVAGKDGAPESKTYCFRREIDTVATHTWEPA